MTVAEASSPVRSSGHGGFFSVESGRGRASGCGERGRCEATRDSNGRNGRGGGCEGLLKLESRKSEFFFLSPQRQEESSSRGSADN